MKLDLAHSERDYLQKLSLKSLSCIVCRVVNLCRKHQILVTDNKPAAAQLK